MALSEGLMSFEELVTHLKGQCKVEYSRVRAGQGTQVHLNITFKEFHVAVMPQNNRMMYLCERHTLQEIHPTALREAFRQLIAEGAKKEWGIDFI
ncbi:MAG: hypothetical protein Q8L47_02855 [bacterium]|nr:hypothetical protein [bacterium]